MKSSVGRIKFHCAQSWQIFKVIQSGGLVERAVKAYRIMFPSPVVAAHGRASMLKIRAALMSVKYVIDGATCKISTHLNLISTRKRFQLGLQINNREEIIEERAAVLASNLFINVEDVLTCFSYPRAAGNFIIEQETLLSRLERTENGANHINK